jgi:hypothetical protein
VTQPLPPLQTTLTGSGPVSGTSRHKRARIALAIAVACGVFATGLLLFLWFRLRRTSRRKHTLSMKQRGWLLHSNSNSLPFSEYTSFQIPHSACI